MRKTTRASGTAWPARGFGAVLGAAAWLGLLAAATASLDLFESTRRKMVVAGHIDGAWFRRSLIEDNLAHWLASAPTANGFFRSSLDRQWRPAAKQVGTLVSQSRLLFVFAAGGELTADGAYREAVRKGADFLLANFHDDEFGGWFWSVSPEGEPLDKHKSTYGHAFVLFGLSHALRVTGDAQYAAAALETWDTMKAHLFDEHGGIKPATTRDWKQRRGGNSQNPIMHLFEALLALHDATQSEKVFRDALALADFVFTRLYLPEIGCLPETFDDDWRPLPDDRHGYVDLGHQFEWAFLLSRAVEKGFPRRYLAVGKRLLDFGMAFGFDRAAGGIFGASSQTGRLRGRAKGWWQQTEHLRALMRYAARHGRADLWPAFDQSLAFVRANFIDHEYGGWYESFDPDRPRTDAGTQKGSVWKVGYHTAGMYVEALGLAGQWERSN